MKLNICLLIKDDKLLENVVKSGIKSAIVNKKGFDCKSVYNEKYLKTEIKSYEGKAAQNFMMMEYQKKVLTVFVYQ